MGPAHRVCPAPPAFTNRLHTQPSRSCPLLTVSSPACLPAPWPVPPASSSQLGTTVSVGGHSGLTGDVFGCQELGVLLGSSGQSPEILLNPRNATDSLTLGAQDDKRAGVGNARAQGELHVCSQLTRAPAQSCKPHASEIN